MVSGAILVETVFSWPGIGQLAIHGVGDRDTPLLVGIFLVSSVAVILANLLTDFLYTVIDPRIRVG
jgi:peptide/nickel transport system permease protein